MLLQLHGASGSLAGQAIALPPSGGVVGRSTACNVVLADDLASRQHAAFRPAGAGWTVVDLGSTNGTRLNGHPLAPQQPASLQAGDQVQIGGSAFLVVLIPAATAARPPATKPTGLVGPLAWTGRLLAGSGGALLIAGAFLPWLQVTVTPTLLGFSLGEQTVLIGGMQGFGPLTLAIGVLLLVVVLADVLLRSDSRWPGVAILLLVAAGLAIMAIGMVTFEASSQQMVRELGRAFGIDLPAVLESDVFQELLSILGHVIQPQITLREGILVTAVGLLSALLGGVSRTPGSRQ